MLTLMHIEFRVYRGSERGHGLSFIADGGSAEAEDVHAYTMGSIWTSMADMPAKTEEPALSIQEASHRCECAEI